MRCTLLFCVDLMQTRRCKMLILSSMFESYIERMETFAFCFKEKNSFSSSNCRILVQNSSSRGIFAYASWTDFALPVRSANFCVTKSFNVSLKGPVLAWSSFLVLIICNTL